MDGKWNATKKDGQKSLGIYISVKKVTMPRLRAKINFDAFHSITKHPNSVLLFAIHVAALFFPHFLCVVVVPLKGLSDFIRYRKMMNSKGASVGKILEQEYEVDSSIPRDSPITDFLAGKVVFLTGPTGFLGHLLLEKLLR